VKVGGILISMLCFAHDVIILTTSEIKATLNLINTIFKEYNLKINAVKTKTLICYKENIALINITLGNKEIVQVN